MKSRNLLQQFSNQPCDCSSNVLFKRLQQNLQDLSEELSIVNKKNQQLNKLVLIVTEERNYYHDELQKIQIEKNTIEESLNKRRNQYESKNVLVGQLKKANKLLAEQVLTLKESLEETKFLFEAQEQQIDRIRKQKKLIESEWNKTIKQVNFKMNNLQKKQEQQQKQNMEIYSNLPLKDKVKKVLKKIDREIKQQEDSSKFYKNEERPWKLLKQSPASNTTFNQTLQQQSYLE